MYSWEIAQGLSEGVCPFKNELFELRQNMEHSNAEVRRPAIARLNELMPHIHKCGQCTFELRRILERYGDAKIFVADMSGKDLSKFALKVAGLAALSFSVMVAIAIAQQFGGGLKLNNNHDPR